MPSPSPSNGSTTSSTSLVSEGRKSTTSGGNAQAAKKFGESIINFFSWNQFHEKRKKNNGFDRYFQFLNKKF